MTRTLPVLLLACASLLSAQTRKPSAPPSSSKLISINVTGSSRYTPEQIIAATGLQRGQNVSEEDFKSVTRHLGETGAFSDVAYTFQFGPEGMKLALQVTDNNPFVPVRFENFVWFSDQELFEKLRTRVPLFQGQLPVTGDLADEVSEALQVLAIELKLRGRVDYLRAGPEDGPMEAFEFSITGQPIIVRKVAFSGASPAELPELEAAARKLAGKDYTRSLLMLQAEKNFLPVFLARGYLKAAVGAPQPKVAEDTPEETLVDVDFSHHSRQPVQSHRGPAFRLQGCVSGREAACAYPPRARSTGERRTGRPGCGSPDKALRDPRLHGRQDPPGS